MAPVAVRPLALRLQWGMTTHEHTWFGLSQTFLLLWQWSPWKESMILIWASTDISRGQNTNLIHQIITHKHPTQYGDYSISSAVTIAIELWVTVTCGINVLLICLLGLFTIVTYFSTFKLLFTLRASASAEAPDSPIAFPSRLWRRVHVLQN